MPVRKPLVLVSGSPQQLQAGDTLDDNRSGYYQPRAILASHFLGGLGDWSATTAGTGAAIATGSVANPGGRSGIARGVSGSTSTGRTGLAGSNSSVRFGNGNCYARFDARLPAVSDGTNRYTVRAGFTSGTDEPVYGVYFRYADNVNSGNWQCVSRRNDVETVINTSVGVVANAWFSLRLEYINSTGAIEFFINDASQGTINTNVPQNANNEQMRGTIYLTKSVGTASTVIEIDYAYTEVDVI